MSTGVQITVTASPIRRQRPRWDDRAASAVAWALGLTVVALTGLIVIQLWHQSQLARHQYGWGFLLSTSWSPPDGPFGALPFLYGTVVTSGLALCLAVPVGIGAAVFLNEFAPARLAAMLNFVVELLASVPSVVIGLLGIFVLVPWLRNALDPLLARIMSFPVQFRDPIQLLDPSFAKVLGFGSKLFQGPIFGIGLLAGGLILAIMIVPYIVAVSREVLAAVPAEQREAALALGATPWEAATRAVLPGARSGIIGSVFLALARALGETMAVTMVIGNDPKISASLFAPGYSIAAVLANEFSEAIGKLYVSSLIELGLVLFALTFLLNGVARLLVGALGESEPR